VETKAAVITNPTEDGQFETLNVETKVAIINDPTGDYQFEIINLGELHPDEVVVKVVASGICQSDEGVRDGSMAPLPAVLGHEGAGIIEKVGSGVKDFKVGDQVVMSFGYCTVCESCRTGQPSTCDHYNELNITGGEHQDGTHRFYKKDGTPVSNFLNQGSFSTYTITSEASLIKVDPNADLRKLAPLGCGLMTGFGTVTSAMKPETGSSIAVFGTGAVGLGAMMTAKIEGCSTIIAVDIVDARLELARELGATHTINSKTENLQERIAEITNGKGVNYSVDTTGVSQVMVASVQALSKNGVAVPLAVTKNTMDFNPLTELVLGTRKLLGVNLGNVVPQLAVPKLVEYYNQGKFPFDKLIKYYKFEDINKAASDAVNGIAIKPVLIIDEEYRKDDPIEYVV
jgi:aryl-alcohol dehydrogenase